MFGDVLKWKNPRDNLLMLMNSSIILNREGDPINYNISSLFISDVFVAVLYNPCLGFDSNLINDFLSYVAP